MAFTFHLEEDTVEARNRERWFAACHEIAHNLAQKVPEYYRSRSFSGILGDIKALPSKKALSLISRKKGLGTQYARLYLEQGIDGGRGYQACAASALGELFRLKRIAIEHPVLDIGCAVGVTAGILNTGYAIGLDLFPDLLDAAAQVDGITGKRGAYVAADMTKPWPISSQSFGTVVCGLVCHHLKAQRDCVRFFSEANRVLKPGGRLVITLPSGSVDTPDNLSTVMRALESFGFACDTETSGLCASTDSRRSLFWMFTIVAQKVGGSTADYFIGDGFGFHTIRTPVTRVQKADKARETSTKNRSITHRSFVFYESEELLRENRGAVLVYDTVRQIAKLHH